MWLGQIEGLNKRDQLAVNKLMEVAGNLDINQVTTHDLELLLDGKIKLSSAWRYAYQIKAVWKKRFEIQLEMPDFPKYTPQIHIKFLTLDQIKNVYKHSRKSSGVYKWIVVAMETGLRRGEIAQIRFKDLDWDQKEIFLPADHTKTGKCRRIFMTPNVLDIMRQVFKDSTDGTFESRTVRKEVVSVTFGALTKRLGYNIGFHGLRHSFITTLIGNGIPVPEVMQYAGHTNMATTQLYAHVLQDSTNAKRVLESLKF